MDPPVRWRRPTGAAKIAKDRPRDRAVFERRRIGPSGCAHRMYGDAPRTVAPHDRPESARGVCAPSKGRSPGSLLFSAPFPGRKTSQWIRPMLPSLQWRVRAGLAPDFPNTFRGCVVCPITIRQKTGMSNGFHSRKTTGRLFTFAAPSTETPPSAAREDGRGPRRAAPPPQYAPGP